MLPAIDDSDYFVSEELRGMSTKVIEYLMDNFASPLGFSSLRPESLHHFVDGLLAFRAFFCSIGYLELSKEIEDCLDEIQKFAHDIDYKSLTGYRICQPQNPEYYDFASYMHSIEENKSGN